MRAAQTARGGDPSTPTAALWPTWPRCPAHANSQGWGPQDPKRPGGPPLSWGLVPYLALRAMLPLFCLRPPLPCPCATAMTRWRGMNLQGFALLTGVRLPAGGQTLVCPTALWLPTRLLTLSCPAASSAAGRRLRESHILHRKGETARSEHLHRAPRAIGHGGSVGGRAHTALGEPMDEPLEAVTHGTTHFDGAWRCAAGSAQSAAPGGISSTQAEDTGSSTGASLWPCSEWQQPTDMVEAAGNKTGGK